MRVAYEILTNLEIRSTLEEYRKEWKTWPEFQKRKFTTRKETKKRINELAKHFKVPEPVVMIVIRLVDSSNAEIAGSYNSMEQSITLVVDQLTLGLMCHEFTHHLTYVRKGDLSHGTKYNAKLKQVYAYAKRWL